MFLFFNDDIFNHKQILPRKMKECSERMFSKSKDSIKKVWEKHGIDQYEN